MELSSDTLNSFDLETAIENIKSVSKTKSINGLASALGVSGPGLHGAIKKGELPYKALINTAVKQGWSLDEIFGIKVKQGAMEQARPVAVEEQQTKPKVDKGEALRYYTVVESVINKYLRGPDMAKRNLAPETVADIRAKLFKILFEQAIQFDGNQTLIDAVARSALELI